MCAHHSILPHPAGMAVQTRCVGSGKICAKAARPLHSELKCRCTRALIRFPFKGTLMLEWRTISYLEPYRLVLLTTWMMFYRKLNCCLKYPLAFDGSQPRKLDIPLQSMLGGMWGFIKRCQLGLRSASHMAIPFLGINLLWDQLIDRCKPRLIMALHPKWGPLP